MTSRVDWAREPDGRLVCYCAQVSKGAVVGAIQAGALEP